MNRIHHKYLVISEADESWGLTVNTVGMHDIQRDYDAYPPSSGHPSSFYFEPERGRVLDSYQLLYITSGSGFFYKDCGRRMQVQQGDMILLKPGEWHSYFPDRKTGWKEYWIGFRGRMVEEWLNSRLFDSDSSVYRVGIHEDIIDVYEQAISVAMREKAAYQQYLAGAVSMLMGIMVYRNKNLSMPNAGIASAIAQAKMKIREQMLENVDFEELAGSVNMSYSWFRKMFKTYTGISPAHYHQALKIQHAKRLLSTTDIPIKEIAYTLNYESTSHFTSIFGKYVGTTPLVYRETCRGQKSKNDN